MAKALGATEQEEYKTNVRLIAESLSGNVGLFFSDNGPGDVKDFFETCKEVDYARGGGIATMTFTLPKGMEDATEWSESF
jgi:ribosomal protein L10